MFDMQPLESMYACSVNRIYFGPLTCTSQKRSYKIEFHFWSAFPEWVTIQFLLFGKIIAFEGLYNKRFYRAKSLDVFTKISLWYQKQFEKRVMSDAAIDENASDSNVSISNNSLPTSSATSPANKEDLTIDGSFKSMKVYLNAKLAGIQSSFACSTLKENKKEFKYQSKSNQIQSKYSPSNKRVKKEIKLFLFACKLENNLKLLSENLFFVRGFREFLENNANNLNFFLTWCKSHICISNGMSGKILVLKTWKVSLIYQANCRPFFDLFCSFLLRYSDQFRIYWTICMSNLMSFRANMLDFCTDTSLRHFDECDYYFFLLIYVINTLNYSHANLCTL